MVRLDPQQHARPVVTCDGVGVGRQPDVGEHRQVAADQDLHVRAAGRVGCPRAFRVREEERRQLGRDGVVRVGRLGHWPSRWPGTTSRLLGSS